MAKYAPGTQAWGRCQRCSQKFYLRDLVFDGYMPGLRVCIDCYDPRHPQEFLQDTADPQGLWQPSPEFGPVGPTLTVTQGTQSNILNWTKADPAGGPRIINYTLTRAVSYDGGLNFQPFEPIYTAVVQYDEFGALLYEPDHPLDYTPYVPPGTTIIDPYTYTDTAVVVGLTYQYQVLAYITNHRNVPSNVVQAASVLVLEYLTSRPYPIFAFDGIGVNFKANQSAAQTPIEGVVPNWSFTAGNVMTLLLTYSNYAPEGLVPQWSWTAGAVVTELINYTYYAPEGLTPNWQWTAGSVVLELITYSNYAPEGLAVSWQWNAGTVA